MYKDTNIREYGSLIYKSGNMYYYTPILMGPMPEANERAAVDLRVAITGGLVPRDVPISANVHTHPVNEWSGRPSGEDVVGIHNSKYYGTYFFTNKLVSPDLNGYLWTKSFGRNILSYTGTSSPDAFDSEVSKQFWIPF